MRLPVRADAAVRDTAAFDRKRSAYSACKPATRASSRDKSVPGQATARPLRSRRCAPTALRCSALQPATELASLTPFATLKQWRRVSSRSALARAAASPVLLGAPQARRGLSEHALAVAFALGNEREEPSRRAVPAGGDLLSDEDRRPGVGARSALRELTRRNCLSVTNEVNEASSATRPLAENRSAVGVKRRPRNHEPSAGTAWLDAQAHKVRREAQALHLRHDEQALQLRRDTQAPRTNAKRN